jgi:hypothetical protein
MILLTVTETWFLYIGIVVAAIILLGLIFYLTCGLRSKREKKAIIEHVKIDEAFDKELFSKILSEAKRLFPGMLEETYEFGWIESGAPTLDPKLGWDESDASSGEN